MSLGLFRGHRFAAGGRIITPVGRPVRIGPDGAMSGASRKWSAGGLAKVDEYGSFRSITLTVGQNKGKEPKNQAGRCAGKPKKFTVKAIDEAFAEIRRSQVERHHVDATRQAGRGWFRGDPERSLTYEIAYVPPQAGGPPDERTFEVFRRHMDRLAERLAERFCQDSVLIVREDGKKKTVAGASWKPGGKRKG